MSTKVLVAMTVIVGLCLMSAAVAQDMMAMSGMDQMSKMMAACTQAMPVSMDELNCQMLGLPILMPMTVSKDPNGKTMMMPMMKGDQMNACRSAMHVIVPVKFVCKDNITSLVPAMKGDMSSMADTMVALPVMVDGRFTPMPMAVTVAGDQMMMVPSGDLPQCKSLAVPLLVNGCIQMVQVTPQCINGTNMLVPVARGGKILMMACPPRPMR